MTLTTVDEFLKKFPWMNRSVSGTQLDKDGQNQVQAYLKYLATTYAGTPWNVRGDTLGSEYNVVVVYINAYFPGVLGAIYTQVQLFVEHSVTGKFGLFDLTLASSMQNQLIKDITDLANKD